MGHTKGLNVDEYREIMNEIWEKHRFDSLSGLEHKGKCKHVKYVDPVWDMRDGRCFTIRFRGLSLDKKFDFRESEELMFDRIMNWLNSNR